MNDPFHESTFSAAQRAARDADEVEDVAIRLGSATIDTGTEDERISQDHLDEVYATGSGVDEPAWFLRDAALETADRLIVAEIRRRSEQLGVHYPFKLQKPATLVYIEDRSKTSVYEFCLSFSLTRHEVNRKPANSTIPAFELIVGESLQAFMGVGSLFFRLGWPPEKSHGRPGKFSEAIKLLHQQTSGEWAFAERTNHPAPPAEQGDNGIDIVVWKPFGNCDKRLGVPMVLGQCACGKDALDEKKWGEMSPGSLETEYRGTVSHAGYLRCLAIPHHLPHPSRWNTAVAKGGVLLDRIRLTWLAEEHLNGADLKSRLRPHIDVLNTPPSQKQITRPRRPSKKKQQP